MAKTLNVKRGEWRTRSKESQLTFAYFSAHGESMQQTSYVKSIVCNFCFITMCVCVCRVWHVGAMERKLKPRPICLFPLTHKKWGHTPLIIAPVGLRPLHRNGAPSETQIWIGMRCRDLWPARSWYRIYGPSALHNIGFLRRVCCRFRLQFDGWGGNIVLW